ncbi:MAG TPA: D-lyxose/D-mannose family sugar isomerase [Firmicutes bacterium]|jgi:D-lyxose ketol-isomerase|nr:D-lyxose/D-mannose family sugar isomerase [Bacillota bacterium]
MVLPRTQEENARQRALTYFQRAGIYLTKDEMDSLKAVDFGLGRLEEIGLERVVYVKTGRCCAKEMILFPGQTCPEHIHLPFEAEPGKEETFRCRWGKVYLYVPGKPVQKPQAKIPEDLRQYFTVWHEIVLTPGGQYTLAPNTLHWFQGGPDGAVVSEFSTNNRDEADIYSNPEISMAPRRN